MPNDLTAIVTLVFLALTDGGNRVELYCDPMDLPTETIASALMELATALREGKTIADGDYSDCQIVERKLTLIRGGKVDGKEVN